jgi:hypothetical protein
MLVFTGVISGLDKTWIYTGDIPGDWTVGTNWDDGLPTLSDDAHIDNGYDSQIISSTPDANNDWSLWAGLLTVDGQPLINQPGIMISAGGDQ